MFTQLRTRSLLVAAAGMMAFASCQQDESVKPADQPLQVETASKPTKEAFAAVARVSNTPVSNNCGPYKIILEKTVNNGNGTYTWTWSVKNPAPGNGYCNTIQNLCYWAIKLNNCYTQSNGCYTYSANGLQLSNIISAAISCNNSTWYSFDADDYSCYGYLFFPYGTSGSSKTYYRITVNKDFQLKNNSPAFYFSGCKTGDGLTCFPGLGCPEPTPDGGGGDKEE